MEHPDGIQGVFIQALADQGQFLKDVMSHGDDMTATSSAWKIFSNSRGLAQINS